MITDKQWKVIKKYSKRRTPAEREWAQRRFGEKALTDRIRTESWTGREECYMNQGNPHGDWINHCCGVGELRVSGITSALLHSSMLDYFLSNCRHVIATCNSRQKQKCTMLKEWGFKVVSDWSVNPNTGRRIIVLMFTFPEL